MNQEIEAFLHHIYQKVWLYIIQYDEFDEYLRVNKGDVDYWHEDLYTDSTFDLIKHLKEYPNFYETYKKLIPYINPEIKPLISNFIKWFNGFEHIDPNKFFNDIHMYGYREDKRVTDMVTYVKTLDLKEQLKIIERPNSKIESIINILNRFTSLSKILSMRRAGKPIIEITDEYDVQDLLHLLLKSNFLTLKPEEVVPGNAARKFLKIDFIASLEKIGIECKCIRDEVHANSITKEINDDIQTYHNHEHCENLIYFIYDKNQFIKEPDTLEKAYTKSQSFDGKKMDIILIIRPNNYINFEILTAIH